ncbi:MAG: segregation/condensation protein A [Candidatus Sulfobium sp.]
MEELYEIKLPVFEGPLDLLLHLIREAKIDIYDIPISFITHRYLEYIEMMKELNLDIAGEFLVMAATLIHIKSKMLLPPDEVEEAEEPEDPRLELVQRLLEYQTYKDAAYVLKEKEDEALLTFGRPPENEEGEEGAEPELYLFDVTRELLTVKDRMVFIVELLEKSEAVRFEELFERQAGRPQLIVSFLALLELLRLGLARVYQEREFGNIWIIKKPDMDLETGPDREVSVGVRP